MGLFRSLKTVQIKYFGSHRLELLLQDWDELADGKVLLTYASIPLTGQSIPKDTLILKHLCFSIPSTVVLSSRLQGKLPVSFDPWHKPTVDY